MRPRSSWPERAPRPGRQRKRGGRAAPAPARPSDAYGGARAESGVLPGLPALGKIVGGGLPLAAVAGRAEILELANPRAKGPRYTYVSGTLNGNAPAAAAGLATLRELRKPGAYERL